jgi:hypothetical protein
MSSRTVSIWSIFSKVVAEASAAFVRLSRFLDGFALAPGNRGKDEAKGTLWEAQALYTRELHAQDTP